VRLARIEATAGRRHRSAFNTALGGLGCIFALSGCLFAGGGSAAAVCNVWNTEGRALQHQFSSVGSGRDPLAGLGELAAAPQAMASLMNDMAGAAPSNIQPAFQTLASAFGQIAQNSSGGNVLGALASGLADDYADQNAENQVNAFISQNCRGSNG
jgi:hypothetical protein